MKGTSERERWIEEFFRIEKILGRKTLDQSTFKIAWDACVDAAARIVGQHKERVELADLVPGVTAVEFHGMELARKVERALKGGG